MTTLCAAGWQAAAQIGIEWIEFPADGRWHAVPAEGKVSRNGAGRIKIFPDGEGGQVYNWITGECITFWARDEFALDPSELAARRQRSEELRTQAKADRQQEAKEVAAKAVQLWSKAGPANEAPYLTKKGVGAVPSLRQIDSEKASEIIGYTTGLTGKLLVVPIKVDDRLSSCQLICADGRKHFLRGGFIKAGFWATGTVHDDATVLIAEGVATALSCKAATGHPAVASMSGGNLLSVASAIRKTHPKSLLVICSDKGKGEEAAQKAANQVQGLLIVPKINGEGTDFNDVHQNEGLEAVKEHIAKAAMPPPQPPSEDNKKPESRIHVVDALDFMAMEFPPRENILTPWLPSQGLAMVYAPRGIGKTHFSLGVAYAVASGGKFFTWEAPIPRGVLFLDGEMPGAVLQDRLARIAASSDQEPIKPLRIVTPDLQPNGMIDLSRTEDQLLLAPHLDGIDLIIVDNLSTLCRSGKENEGEGWMPVQGWALSQRAAGRSVLYVHHAGKNGGQRGTSRREDVLDTVIALRRPGDYTPDKGALFEVHFEKARGLFGDDTKPFEAQLFTDDDGTQTWAIKALEESTVEKVASALNDGIPQHEIADLLGVAKGTVSKAKKKAQELGLIKVS